MGADPQWLAGLKAGDEVVVINARQNRSIFTIKKITLTQVVVHNTLRFRRKDGSEIGRGSYIRCSLEPVTQNDRDAAEAERLRQSAAAFLNMRTFGAGDLPMIKRVHAAITAPRDPVHPRQRF